MDRSLVTTFTIVYAGAALIAFGAAAVMWRRREAPAAASLALMLLAATVWAVCDAVELHMPTADLKEFISQIQYIGVISAAPFFFQAARDLSGPRQRMGHLLTVAVWGIPLLSLAIAWTNPWHHWLWTSITLPTGRLPFSTYHYGLWFWILTAQHYALMVAATVLLLRAIRRVSEGFRLAMVLVIIAVVLPWMGNAAYNLKLGPWPGLNWLTLSLGVSGWLLVWVVVGEGLLDLLPRAHGALLDVMSDGVLVVDRGGHVIFRNPSAHALDVDVVSAAMGVASLKTAPLEWRGEASAGHPDAPRWLDLRVGPVHDRWGALAGRIVVARDVTFQKALEDERERLVDELQEALARVSRLEGLLPTCANCHRVRDDTGEWKDLEAYVGSHTPVEFTHAICPDCSGRLYPELNGETRRRSEPT